MSAADWTCQEVRTKNSQSVRGLFDKPEPNRFVSLIKATIPAPSGFLPLSSRASSCELYFQRFSENYCCTAGSSGISNIMMRKICWVNRRCTLLWVTFCNKGEYNIYSPRILSRTFCRLILLVPFWVLNID